MNIIFYPYNICPECYSSKLITDEGKQETYCSSCGLIVRDNSIMTIQQQENDYLREKENKEKEEIIKLKIQQDLQQYKEVKITGK